MKCFRLSKMALILSLILFGLFIILLLTYKKKEHLDNPTNANVQITSNNIFANIIANITSNIKNNSKIISDKYTNNSSITGNIELDKRLQPNIFQNTLNDIIGGNIIPSANISNISPNIVINGSYVNNFKNNMYGFDVCKDNETVATNCPYWATAGDCITRADYMNINCKKSCGKC